MKEYQQIKLLNRIGEGRASIRTVLGMHGYELELQDCKSHARIHDMYNTNGVLKLHILLQEIQQLYNNLIPKYKETVLECRDSSLKNMHEIQEDMRKNLADDIPELSAWIASLQIVSVEHKPNSNSLQIVSVEHKPNSKPKKQQYKFIEPEIQQ